MSVTCVPGVEVLSRVTRLGGGATTLGWGSERRDVIEVVLAGADTGGGTTFADGA
jgi:hypothetical protein